MDKKFYTKSDNPDFTNPPFQRAFIEDAHSSKELLRKELEVNKMEQRLLEKRIQMMKELANDLSTSDPRYSVLRTTIDMDQVEWDELKLREEILFRKLSDIH